MGSAHEDQGRFQVVVMFFVEFLVVLLSQLVVVFVELGSIVLLIPGELVLFLTARNLVTSWSGAKKLTHPPVPRYFVLLPHPPPALLRGPG